MSIQKKGFTLIELLVVISIISLLSSVVFASVNSARTKARDAKRLVDKNSVVTAMNLYYNDHNAWPTANVWTCFGALDAETCEKGTKNGSTALVNAMSPYMSNFPTNNADPGNYGYNRMEYHSGLNPNCCDHGGGAPAGSWIWWIQETGMPASICPPDYAWTYVNDKYYYCFDWLGP